ncbi:MAG: Ribonuclease P protein component 4 [archaeon GW2011_AR20]|nr:MAG: Ribonuclease P protein component 4 [archaeon GW2011_AR20]MBS3160772.1 ribonuclease P [Candidatus Woesearchaeota archaeon]
MKNKSKLKKEVLSTVNNLFKLAEVVSRDNPKLANKYINLARKNAMKVNLKLPRNLKRKFCKHCYSYLVPGKNCRVRMHKSRIIYYCFNCKKYMRFVKR